MEGGKVTFHHNTGIFTFLFQTRCHLISIYGSTRPTKRTTPSSKYRQIIKLPLLCCAKHSGNNDENTGTARSSTKPSPRSSHSVPLSKKKNSDSPSQNFHATDIFKELLSWVGSGEDAAAKVALVAAVLSFTLSLALTYQNTVPPEIITPPLPPEPTLTEQVSSQLYAFAGKPQLVVGVVMGLACLLQSIVGFGFSIVALGILQKIPWIANSSIAQDVLCTAALLSGFQGTLLVALEFSKIFTKNNIRQLAPLMGLSLVFQIPGKTIAQILPQAIVMRILGALVLGYVAYAATGMRPPKKIARAPWIFGALGGMFSGAVNIGGPIFIIYGDASEWPKEQFRLNMLALGGINTLWFIFLQYIAGAMDDYFVSSFFFYSLPFFVLGSAGGTWIKSRIDAAAFRNVLLGVCLILGIRLMT